MNLKVSGDFCCTVNKKQMGNPFKDSPLELLIMTHIIPQQIISSTKI